MKYKKRQHISRIYLDYVGIRHTKMYHKGLISDNIDQDTFSGIRKILLNYKINSIGLRLSLSELKKIKDDPIILQIDNGNNTVEFVILIKSFENKYVYINELGETIIENIQQFEKKWKGVILFPEVTEDSEEENYYQHLILGFATAIKKGIISFFFLFVFLWLLIEQEIIRFPDILLISLYAIGVAICSLLVLQSLNIDNLLAKKICGINKKTSCKNVLNSKGAKLFNLIGWGEIGIIYFTGCLLSLILIPSSLPLLFWLNIFSLPYAVWSLLYQHYIVKQWCVLCLIVQLLFGLLFLVFLYNGIPLLQINMSISSTIIFMICFIIPSFVLWTILPILDKANRHTSLQYSYNKIKANSTIFNNLLKKQKTIKLSLLARSLSIGRRDALITITVVSNPYCGHCATLHKRVMGLLEKYPNNFNAEFVFVGDNFMENTIKFLIGTYFKYEEAETIHIYNEWYKKRDKILKLYPIDIMDEKIHTLYLAQKQWLEDKDVEGTPTIYINGFELPEYYSIEDMCYFLSLD